MAAPKKAVGPKSDKLIRDALMVAINRETTGPDGKKNKRLWLIADQLAEMAAQGDLQAIKEVTDRIDGKSHQTAEITHIRQRAAELSDDELAGIVAAGRGRGVAEASVDPSQLN